MRLSCCESTLVLAFGWNFANTPVHVASALFSPLSSPFPPFSFFFLVLYYRVSCTQAGIQLTIQLRMTLNFWYSRFYLTNAGINKHRPCSWARRSFSSSPWHGYGPARLCFYMKRWSRWSCPLLLLPCMDEPDHWCFLRRLCLLYLLFQFFSSGEDLL